MYLGPSPEGQGDGSGDPSTLAFISYAFASCSL